MSDAERLKRKILGNFAAKAFGRALSVNNIFVERENDRLEKFSKTVVIIPWYLKPFSRVITNIAYNSFKDGLSENCTDTVTFKRPAPYEAKR